MNRIALIATICILATAAAACQRATPTPSPTQAPTPTSSPPTPTAEPDPSPQDLVSTIRSNAALSTLAAGIESADLVEKLESAGPFTVFAPTNAAFEAVSSVDLDDPDVLFDVLLFHVVEGNVALSDLSDGNSITTLLGDELLIATDDDGLTVGDASISESNIEATNGTIHIIDAVQLPALE